MKEAEIASSIVNAALEAESALGRANTAMAESWLNVSRHWTYLLENVDLDYEPEEEEPEYDEADDAQGSVVLAAGTLANSGLTYHIEADLDPRDDDEDDDPDDIKRLGPIEPL